MLKKHVLNYRAPAQLNYLYSLGSLALFSLALQIASGLFLALRYINSTEQAFNSVQFIIRTTTLGYLFQAVHAVGASVFLTVLFFHLLRGLWYKLYKPEHSLVWCSGVILLVLTMLAAFTGYILPWGQMSYWAATVIFNFFSIIPLVGPKIVTLLFGGEVVGQATLSRVYVIHFLVPFIIAILVLIHLIALHKKGSTIKYSNVYTVISLNKFVTKDLAVFSILLLVYLFIIYLFPNLLLDFLNLEKADGMVTPKHIKPEWYFMPFYGILKTIPHKTGGILAMGASIVIFLIYPLLYRLKRWLLVYFLTFYYLYIRNFFFKKIKLNNHHLVSFSQITRKFYLIVFLGLLISVAFFNDLFLGKYYIILYFLLLVLLL